jgi:DNA-binding MarR family transcriptional regulator
MPTRHGNRDDYANCMAGSDGLDITLFRALTLAARQLTVVVEQSLQAEAGISLPEFEILSALAAAPERRARAGALGQMLAWEKSRISHQVGRMERKGLIERFSCEDDLRGTWVGLTDTGAGAIASATPAYDAAIYAQLGQLAETDAGANLAREVLDIGAHVSPDSCQAEVTLLVASLSVEDNA